MTTKGFILSLLVALTSTAAGAAAVTVQQPATAGGYDSTGQYRQGSTGTSGTNRTPYDAVHGAEVDGGSGGGDPSMIWILNDSSLDVQRQRDHFYTDTPRNGLDRNAWHKLAGLPDTTTFRFTNTSTLHDVTMRITFQLHRGSDDTAQMWIQEDDTTACTWTNLAANGYAKYTATSPSCYIAGGGGVATHNLTYDFTLPKNTTKTIQTQGGIFGGSNYDNLQLLDPTSAQVLSSPSGTTAAIVNGTVAPPATFTFGTRTGVTPGEYAVSNEVTLSGFRQTVGISVSSSGTYSKNGAAYVSTPGTASSGDRIRLRVRAPSVNNASNTATFFAGGTRANFSVFTPQSGPDPDDPDRCGTNGQICQ